MIRWFLRRAADRARAIVCAAAAVQCAFFSADLVLASAAHAQSNLYETAIRVNDDVITRYDIAQRTALLRFVGGERAGGEQAAARELVEELLKEQEAKRLGVEAREETVTNALERLVANNRLASIDALEERLAREGIDMVGFQRRLRVNLAWNEILRQKFGSRMQPEDGEVEEALEAAKTEGPVRYDVRRLVVPVSPQSPGATVRKAAQRAEATRRQLKSCDDLMRLAPKFGRGSGPVGMLAEAQMPSQLRSVITSLKQGEASRPLRNQEGFNILMVCSKSRGGGINREQVTNRLRAQKAERFSANYLSDLERTALIENNL